MFHTKKITNKLAKKIAPRENSKKFIASDIFYSFKGYQLFFRVGVGLELPHHSLQVSTVLF